jgi:hypothetical protein
MSQRQQIGSVVFAGLVLFVTSMGVRAEEVSVYRGFHLGMTVQAVAQATKLDPASATTVVTRPVRVQELVWRPPSAERTASGAPMADSVDRVLFGFCNDVLFRIVVNYDSSRTEGLTEADMLEALSAAYGPPHTPTAEARIITSSASQTYADAELVLATWEDTRSAVNLFRGTYRTTFGLVIVSKADDQRARTGLKEGLRMAELDAPERELAEQLARAEAERLSHAKAREANKVTFRY